MAEPGGRWSRSDWWGVVLDTSDVDTLTRFYSELPDHQPQDDVRVLLDPAGHPFCLYT